MIRTVNVTPSPHHANRDHSSRGRVGPGALIGLATACFLLVYPLSLRAEFRFGACCSANGGVCGCKGGGAVCCDGVESTCACNEAEFTATLPQKRDASGKGDAPGDIPKDHSKFLPNPKLTPGDIRSRDRKAICAPGYIKSVGKTPQTSREKAYSLYGIKRRKDFEIDHLVSKGLGGSNDIKNLYPQPFGGVWNVQKKDQLENLLHRLVCSGKANLEESQRQIARDWISLYKVHFGNPKTAKKKQKSKAKAAPKQKNTKS